MGIFDGLMPYAPPNMGGGQSYPGYSAPNMQGVKTKSPTPHIGLLARVNNYLTPDRLQAIGAAAHDLSRGTNTLDDVLQQLHENERQRIADVWSDEQRVQQRSQWKAQDAQMAAGQEYVDSLPADQQPLARVNPTAAATSAFSARQQANAPITPFQQLTSTEDHRHNVAMENKQSGGMGGGDYSPQDIEFYTRQYVQLGHLPTGISIRSPLAAAIQHALPTYAREHHVDPEQFAVVAMAQQGDRGSYLTLKKQRDSIVAWERTADGFLTNFQQKLAAVPREQWSDVGALNEAMQNYNRTGVASGPLAAAVTALVSLRADVARVISGNPSPPVEAMHEAERMLPNGIGRQAFPDVAANLRREMHIKSESYDSTLGDIAIRVRNGEIDNPGIDADTGAGSQGGVVRTDGGVELPADALRRNLDQVRNHPEQRAAFMRAYRGMTPEDGWRYLAQGVSNGGGGGSGGGGQTQPNTPAPPAGFVIDRQR